MVPNGADKPLTPNLEGRSVGMQGAPQDFEQFGVDHAAKRLPLAPCHEPGVLPQPHVVRKCHHKILQRLPLNLAPGIRRLER